MTLRKQKNARHVSCDWHIFLIAGAGFERNPPPLQKSELQAGAD
jgi:hypothetical protein